jgi:hypothetical protein
LLYSRFSEKKPVNEIPEMPKSHLSSHPISQPCQQARPCPKHKHGTYREERLDEKSENIHVDADSDFVNNSGSGQCYYHMNDDYIEWLEDSTDSGEKDMEFNNVLLKDFDDDVGSCQA